MLHIKINWLNVRPADFLVIPIMAGSAEFSFRNNIQTLPDEREGFCASNGLQMPFMGKIPETLAVGKVKIHTLVMCEKWLMKIDELFGTPGILHLQTSWVTRQSHLHLRFNF